MAAAAGCAEELPGTVPPEDQLHFPIGMKIVTTATVAAGSQSPISNDFLIVGSSNFDQRFNAGRLFAMNLRALTDLVPRDAPDVAFVGGFGPAITGSVRVDSFSGELEVVMLDPDGDGQDAPYILSPSRQRNELTVVRLDPADGRLSCTLAGSDRQTGLDCTDSHRISVQGRDAFTVGVTRYFDEDLGEEQDLIAVGGISAANPIAGIFEGTATFMTSRYLEGRLSGVFPALPSAEDCNAVDFFFVGVRGISGFVPLPPTADGGTGLFLSLSLRSSPSLGFTRHEITILRPPEVCSQPPVSTLESFSLPDLRFDVAFAAFETRGVAVSRDGTRAYAVARIADSVDTTNAVVAILDITGETVRLVDALRLGEEFGRPHLDERPNGARLLYIGDQRFDRIFMVNVTSDKAEYVGRIESRGLREVGGRRVEVPLLDQPAQIVFYQEADTEAGAPGRRLAFVSNFSNSTIGVIDVSDDDPRRHRVVARLGRDIDPQGRQEGE